jgi:glycosyltransferase involved in cell wall biosynthesis
MAEGISNTILESMATGLPVIATAVGGNVELVEAGITGECVAPGSVEELARALARAHAEPERMQVQGRAARRRAVERFSLASMVARYAALYEREIAARGPARA